MTTALGTDAHTLAIVVTRLTSGTPVFGTMMLALATCPVTCVAPHRGVARVSRASTKSRHASWGCAPALFRNDAGSSSKTRHVTSRFRRGAAGRVRVRALFDPDTVTDPLVKRAMKEPVAFFGGMFAGFLGLSVDDKDSPLTRWVEATSVAAGRNAETKAAAKERVPPKPDDFATKEIATEMPTEDPVLDHAREQD
jgi:hypothetical protein|tara:strand:+ start:9474 stop:10061 length:588 start_codon:yes stop_codon:yes gene_type:complete